MQFTGPVPMEARKLTAKTMLPIMVIRLQR